MNSEKAQEKIDSEQKKLRINKVANRFLPLTESVLLGLEQESKISDFNIIRQIGEGSFGKVYLVKHNKTGSEYAVKQINKLNKGESTKYKKDLKSMQKAMNKAETPEEISAIVEENSSNIARILQNDKSGEAQNIFTDLYNKAINGDKKATKELATRFKE